MKKKLNLTLLFSAFAALVFAGILHTDVYKVDTSLSSLEWYAEKVSGKHNGTIMISEGELRNNHGNISGFFEIDMSTIKNTDLDAEEKKSKLEGHLKSPDFFDVAKYPKSKFVVTSVMPLNAADDKGNSHSIKGMLTIKDKTNEISFNAAIKSMEGKMTCTGSAVIDRSKFDVKYGSKTFFPEIGDKMINDEFTLKFNIVLVK